MSGSRSLQHLNVSRYANSSSGDRVVYIFDTAAFLSALQLYIYSGDIVTTPNVIQEVKDSDSVLRLELASIAERFRVEIPELRYLEEVRGIARKRKLLEKLSQTDLEVIALALQYKDRGFKPIVFTDDYDIQLMLRSVGIEFKPVKTMGIGKFSTSLRV